MTKKGFGYIKCDIRVTAEYQDQKWQDFQLSSDETMTLHEGSCALHYGQGCFEGLKAYKHKDGRIVVFRPDENAKRFNQSSERLLIPSMPESQFIHALDLLLKHNLAQIPDVSDGSMYIRPFVLGVGEHLGVAPSQDFHFRVFACPVTGSYYQGSMRLAIGHYDRAPRYGIGHVKAMGNYISGMQITKSLREQGYDEVLYLDAERHEYIEETNTSNIIFFKDGSLIVPESPSILPSITVKSIIQLAKDRNIEVQHRPLPYTELAEMDEAAICGTAVTLIPVTEIHHTITNERYTFDTHSQLSALKDALQAIQNGDAEDPYGWNHEVPI